MVCFLGVDEEDADDWERPNHLSQVGRDDATIPQSQFEYIINYNRKSIFTSTCFTCINLYRKALLKSLDMW
jgi:hypothetical protein